MVEVIDSIPLMRGWQIVAFLGLSHMDRSVTNVLSGSLIFANDEHQRTFLGKRDIL